jgi:pyruvate,orthophosphate dikinase
MYGDVVMGVGAESEHEENPFERLLAEKKAKAAVDRDTELTTDDLRSLVTEFKIEILRRTNASFPEDPHQQLWGAIAAVFRSWDTPRARVYRELHEIPDDMGTAVNVQSMVFGNMGNDCATGVAFTRNPSTGERVLYGEYLVNAQGEDVVAGVRTPEPIAALGAEMPRAYEELRAVCERLERHFRDMQDLEFTIQRGKLWLLQTRSGKRSARAMVRIAVEMVTEELIDQRLAIRRIEPTKLDELMHPTIDPTSRPRPIAKGLNASPGAAIGRAVFTATEAEEVAARGESVILVRVETSPEDIHGMKAAAAILTARGGMTSHAGSSPPARW